MEQGQVERWGGTDDDYDDDQISFVMNSMNRKKAYFLVNNPGSGKAKENLATQQAFFAINVQIYGKFCFSVVRREKMYR